MPLVSYLVIADVFLIALTIGFLIVINVFEMTKSLDETGYYILLRATLLGLTLEIITLFALLYASR